jgi:transposase-like protein
MPKPEFTPEFRQLALKRVKSGMTIRAVAQELGLVEQRYASPRQFMNDWIRRPGMSKNWRHNVGGLEDEK